MKLDVCLTPTKPSPGDRRRKRRLGQLARTGRAIARGSWLTLQEGWALLTGLHLAPEWQTLLVAILLAWVFWLGGLFHTPVAHADDTLPLCPAGQEYDAGLCYDLCKDGYDGVGPVCWQRCPDGYSNDGALCRKDASIIAKASYPADQSCSDGYDNLAGVCWQRCPAGYTNTGFFCRKDGGTITKASYPATQSCGDGYDNVLGICWQQCPSGYVSTGAFCEPHSFTKESYSTSATSCQNGYDWVFFVCWQPCPANYTDGGVFCRYDGQTFVKNSYTATQSCGDGYDNVAGICWQQCPSGYVSTGAFCEPESVLRSSYPATQSCGDGYDNVLGICWQQCPSGYTNDGALCRKDAIIFAKESYGRGVGTVPNCDINNLACAGNFAVSSNFRPKPDGYQFENWGEGYDESTDFDTATLIRMFGAAVCQSGSTAQDCTLKATARTWRNAQLAFLQGGHCYGMAVSSQRFFAGLDQQALYQSGVNATYDFTAAATIRSHISELAITQGLTPADGTPDGWLSSGPERKPSDVLNLIRTQLQTQPDEPYVLAIFTQDEQGKTVAGHAVTPYAVQDRGNGVFWLHIYDNNWPTVDRYIVFDVHQETWLYGFGATNPAESADAWQGNAQTATLMLRPTSAHHLTGWRCPFCQQQANASGVTVADQLAFSLSGPGRLLVVDPQSNATGWDFAANRVVNTIPGAEQRDFIGGAGGATAPFIRLPLPATTTPYTVYASGEGVTQTVTLDFQMVGPGYTVGVNHITLPPQQKLKMQIQPDGRQIAFSAEAVGVFSPTITLATDRDPSGNGYLFQVGGVELAPAKTVTVTLDLAQQALHFADNNQQTDTYDMTMLRITPIGAEQLFQSDAVPLPNGDAGAMHFGAWDGEGAMEFVLDGQPQPIANEADQAQQLFLPLVIE